MTQVILGSTLSQGLGLEALKGQLIIVPNVLTGSPASRVTQDNV